MAEQGEKKFAKAFLQELKSDLKTPKDKEKFLEVQFNPESLKLSFANQIQTDQKSSDNKSGTAGSQFVGLGSTKLSVQLWFDVTAAEKEEHKVTDVRRLTQQVIDLMTPKEQTQGDPKQFVPPGVRFQWGSFIFDGIIESIEESVEFFSWEGEAQRAQMTLGLSQQQILNIKFEGDGKRKSPGAKQLTATPEGSTIQGLAASAGRGGDWQGIAAANNIENPRLPETGRMLDLTADLFNRTRAGGI